MAKDKIKTITERQKQFVDAYFKANFNVSEAERLCDLAPRYGYKLLELPTVKEYMAELHKKLEDERILTAQEVLIQLSAVALGKKKETVVIPSGQVIEKSSYIKDEVKALELLGKHYSIFQDNNTLLVDFVVEVEDEDNLEGDLL